MRGDGGTEVITKRALLARIEALEAEVKALKAPPPSWAPQVIGVGPPPGWPYATYGGKATAHPGTNVQSWNSNLSQAQRDELQKRGRCEANGGVIYRDYAAYCDD